MTQKVVGVQRVLQLRPYAYHCVVQMLDVFLAAGVAWIFLGHSESAPDCPVHLEVVVRWTQNGVAAHTAGKQTLLLYLTLAYRAPQVASLHVVL